VTMLREGKIKLATLALVNAGWGREKFFSRGCLLKRMRVMCFSLSTELKQKKYDEAQLVGDFVGAQMRGSQYRWKFYINSGRTLQMKKMGESLVGCTTGRKEGEGDLRKFPVLWVRGDISGMKRMLWK